ncbi:MAG: thioredoxin [Candidatus Shapirobacteria bacterium]
MSNLTDVTAVNFENEVLKSPLPVLVDFWAPWCGPCLMMGPVLEEIASQNEGKMKVVKINTDLPENQALAFQYQINSIPNMKVFKGGTLVKELVGFRPKEVLINDLSEVIG